MAKVRICIDEDGEIYIKCSVEGVEFDTYSRTKALEKINKISGKKFLFPSSLFNKLVKSRLNGQPHWKKRWCELKQGVSGKGKPRGKSVSRTCSAYSGYAYGDYGGLGENEGEGQSKGLDRPLTLDPQLILNMQNMIKKARVNNSLMYFDYFFQDYKKVGRLLGGVFPWGKSEKVVLEHFSHFVQLGLDFDFFSCYNIPKDVLVLKEVD